MSLLLPVLLCVITNTVLVSGSSLSDKVRQTPADMYKNKDKNETAEIICSHSIDSYNRILWYKQSDDGQLRYLGYMVGNTANPETGAGVKMNGGANKGENCTLTTEALELKDSAVYFCAASLHSVTHHCSSVQNPHHHTLVISQKPFTPQYPKLMMSRLHPSDHIGLALTLSDHFCWSYSNGPTCHHYHSLIPGVSSSLPVCDPTPCHRLEFCLRFSRDEL
ncbi:uncharacterized protein LOC112487105 [Cynoglossus semilaevis]|uniref:uncharacterized protein LOC112487105 n=1 Tax=Cynoglossus semilaevis TaxID=244447 RepID=UPI000D62777A|nr:uncharacterized protein LOC112487105 [Cynoglossus semilaevis]